MTPTSALPDLVVSAFAAGPAAAGQPVALSVSVTNQGASGTGAAFQVHVFLDPPAPPTTGMSPTLTLDFGALGPGQTATKTASLTLAPGAHVLSALADALAAVAEASEANNTADLAVVVDEPPPPEPAAPPVDPTLPTSVFGATRFLYTGPDPIQTGVVSGTIETTRAAVLRGKVMTRDGQPLPGARVTILNHPEYGQTLTRAEGMFDLAVNGGGRLTVDYARAGYLPAQRQVDVPWRDWVVLPDVALIPLDTRVSAVDLASPEPVQVARGNPVTDADGTRQATLLFPQGTTATMVFPDGRTQPIGNLNVRATEYTVGPNGPAAMPAELPPTSGYTYALDFTVDEALAAGATEVRFSSPLPFYVENFLGFPVGTTVPLGAYDAARAVWVPAESGRVVKVLGVTNGLADLDVTGDGAADTGAALAAQGITDAERQRLATLYAAGQSLWRVRIPHFTPWDLNWGIGLPDDAVALDEDPSLDEPCPCPGTTPGSIIDVQNQVLGEALGLVGTTFGLHYQSDRLPGFTDPYSLDIPLHGRLTRVIDGIKVFSLPDSLRRIELEVRVAGRLTRARYLHNAFNIPPPSVRFTWDGLDAYGRPVLGPQAVVVRVGYVYGAVPGNTLSFGDAGGAELAVASSRQEFTVWRTWQGKVGAWDARAAGLGGWTLSDHHVYDPGEQVLIRGDGARQLDRSLGPTIHTVAGTGVANTTGDGGPATQAQVAQPQGLAFGPEGSLYIVSGQCCQFASGSVVRRVAPDGVITTVAGTGAFCFGAAPCGDGGPASQAPLNGVIALAAGPDGSLYLSEGNARVRKVGPDGIISTFAGTGVAGFGGDGGPATLAQLSGVLGLAFGPDGGLYIADSSNGRIRRVGPDGVIATVAGGGATFGDGGPATRAQLASPRGVAAGRDGSLYIADTGSQRVRRVTPDGIIRTVAGSGVGGFAGDGGPATQARLSSPFKVAVAPDDTVYVADVGNNRVRWFRPGGPIETLAGTGASSTSGDGGPAQRASLQNLQHGLAVGPDGGVYFSQSFTNTRVRRVAPVVERVVAGELAVPSEDGAEVYLFTAAGRHQRTLDALTGALRYRFAYDGAGRLASVTDGDGNVTAIERDANGNPTAIAGAFGQRTTLSVNVDGFLASVTSPANETVQLAYTFRGLLTGLTKPGGQVTTYGYVPATGRLISATDPTGATKTFARTGTVRDYTVTLTSPLGRKTKYRVEILNNDDLRLTTTDAAGLQARALVGRDGDQTATYPDGTTMSRVLGPDPRWGMRVPIEASTTLTTPGGLVQTATTHRAVALAGPNDLLNVHAFTDTVTINGRVATAAYDGPSRTLTTTSPAGRRHSTVFDNLGRPVREQFGDLDPIDHAYEDRGRIETVTQGQGAGARVTRFAHGPDGFLATVTDPLSQSVALATDAAGRVVELTRPDAGAMRFAYDANGNVIGRTPPGRPEHTFAYNARDELSAYTPPAVGGGDGSTRYAYDADRLPLRTDLPDGMSPGFGHDAAGRLVGLDLPSGDLSVGYDAAGRLATLGAPSVSLAFAYDGELPTGETWAGAVAGAVTRAYDSDFRVTALHVNGADPVTIEYDTDSLPVRVGNLTLTRAAPTGLVTTTTLLSVTDTTSYDGFSAAAGYAASHGGAELFSEAYTRDGLGRLTGKSETIGGATRVNGYTYDLADRLAEVRVDGALVATYAYDANGNRTSFTGPGGTVNGAYDDQDRLLLSGTTVYTYTANGELLRKAAGGQTTAYRYDTLGNLTGATLPGGAELEYLLDGQGRRVGKRVNGALVQGFLYQDGLRPIAELDGAGNVVGRFVYAGGGGTPDYLVRGGATYRVVTDHLGSPRLVVRADDGTIAQRLDYDEFGRVTLDTSPGFQPFGFAGGLYDRDTGLVHFGAREYDPETGRWTSKDPIRFAAGDPNLYAYAANDPINHVDPEGLSSLFKCANPAMVKVCMAAGIIAAPAVSVAQKARPYVAAAGRAIVRAGRVLLRRPAKPCPPNAPPPMNVPSNTIPGPVGYTGPAGSQYRADIPGTLDAIRTHIAALPEGERMNIATLRAWHDLLGRFDTVAANIYRALPDTGHGSGLLRLEQAHQGAVRILGFDPVLQPWW